MNLRNRYAFLCVLGALAPLSEFVPWVFRNGLDMRLFVRLLFANPISSFFALDVLVSAIVIIAFALREAKRGLRGWWAPVAATLLIGGSLGLPLLLLLRERQKKQLLADE